MRFKRVGVLMGGFSAEREVSLQSGEAVADGLDESGYEVIRIDATQSCRPPLFGDRLRTMKYVLFRTSSATDQIRFLNLVCFKLVT